MNSKFFILALLAVAIVSVGCRGKKSPNVLETEPEIEIPQTSPPPDLDSGDLPGQMGWDETTLPPPEPLRQEPETIVPDLQTVYFDFDSAALRSEAKQTLNQNLQWLRQNPDATVRIEGHCDKRGSREYNYSLGQRRADSVREHLVGQGIDPNRLHTISYGEDRPAAEGNTESAYRLNRRARFMVF